MSLAVVQGVVLAPGLQASLRALLLMRPACCPLLGSLWPAMQRVSMHWLQLGELRPVQRLCSPHHPTGIGAMTFLPVHMHSVPEGR